MEQDKKKLESMADIMKSPTKVVLLLVTMQYKIIHLTYL